MTRQQKTEVVEFLTEKLNNAEYFYIADSSGLNVADINEFREQCYEKGVEYKVAKNTLIRKAMERSEKDYEGLYDLLKGFSALMFTEVSNEPAKVIQAFRKTHELPVLKGAYIDSAIYVGDDKVEELSKLKSKDELIGEVITLLQSPAKNVISALQSGGGTLAGILKTLSERES